MNERIHLSRVFVSAIVQNAAKRLHVNVHRSKAKGQFLAKFVRAAQSYDGKSEDFQLALNRADVRSKYANLGGKQVDQEGTRLAQVGFNYARARHPLLYNEGFILKDDANEEIVKSKSSPTCPVPSACAAFLIEPTFASDHDDEEEVEAKMMDSFKLALRSKH